MNASVRDDVVTEIVFPVPEYEYSVPDREAPPPKLEELERQGLVGSDDHFPLWSVQVHYHWLPTVSSPRSTPQRPTRCVCL